MFKTGRDHLDEVQEGYFEHLGHALLIAARLVKAGLACFVHAILPGLFTRTATRCIADILESNERRAVAREARVGPSLTEMILGSAALQAEPALIPFEDKVAA